MTLIYLGAGAGLFLMGLHALLVQQQVLRRVIAVNVMGSGVFMVMVALASRSSPPDPLLHALVVTGLVVAISATAFALRLALGTLRARHQGAASVRDAGLESPTQGKELKESGQ